MDGMSLYPSDQPKGKQLCSDWSKVYGKTIHIDQINGEHYMSWVWDSWRKLNDIFSWNIMNLWMTMNKSISWFVLITIVSATHQVVIGFILREKQVFFIKKHTIIC